ncbi:MAG TPA: DNA-binding domain-containing protein [Caulobacteraceae bacterium]|jgi:hypothetical protein
MSALAAAQGRMLDALARPGADPAAAQALFAGGGRLGPAAGLAVYQRGYVLRLAACLGEQFPALRHALGGALFDDFAADYLRDCPPQRHTLHDLGRRFPAWLAANRPEREAPEPWADFMIDLAAFEYAVFTLFDAPGAEGGPLAAADTPDERLRLQPAFALGAYGFPVAAYHHAVRRGEAPAPPDAAPSHVALVRTDYVVRTVPLTATHHAFLARMQAGGSVQAALAEICARFQLDPAEARRSWRSPQGSRARWLDCGFFIAA